MLQCRIAWENSHTLKKEKIRSRINKLGKVLMIPGKDELDELNKTKIRV